MRLLACWLALLALALYAEARPNRIAKESTCGYESCNPIKAGVLNVHVVPHTHDDVGWLKTIDQYYYGSKTNVQRAGVQYILDSVMQALLANPDRRFIYVEMAFFWRWWLEQDEQTRESVQLLVSEGRLEFAGGAWSMNDEATTHYQSLVDQFTWGLRKLNDTFGACGRPRAGWQIDPFGHSREQANLFSAMGYDGMVLNRVDFQDKRARVANKEMEVLWRGSDDLGAVSDLFTGITFNHYSPPPGFCFDILCGDDPIIDDVTSPDYNVDSKVKDFVDFVERQQLAYRTNNVIVTMGDDFHYQDAHVWFKNLDKLIKYVNAKEPKVNLFYSTPSCYIKAVNDADVSLPTKEDDFFPYGSDDHSYWTGYYSSRPTLKYFERKANNILQVCKQLNAITTSGKSENVGLDMLRSALGVMQHHDAITGTEKQNVANDYARILDQSVQECLVTVQEALNKLMTDLPNTVSGVQPRDAAAPKADLPLLSLTLCELNITQCSVSEQANSFVVTVYNPLGQSLDHYVRVPVAGSEYLVRDSEGKQIPTQLVTIIPSSVVQLARDSIATEELVFLAADLPPLGYRSYYVTSVQRQILGEEREKVMEKAVGEATKEADDDENSIGNDRLTLSVDPQTGFVSSLFIAGKNLTIPLRQELLYYLGEGGNNNGRASGAYVFRPRGTNTTQISTKPVNTIHKGALVEELNQQFSEWASQTIRIYKDSNHVECEWVVGPIPVDDGIGREVISRFSTGLDTAGTFYTDSNGRQLLKRVRDKRASWEVELLEPASGNYYPVTSVISLRDQTSGLELSVLTDRAQGGSSLKDGELELMVHRRLLHDDGFGAGEALNEQVGDRGLVAKGTHYLHVGDSQDKGAATRRQLILAKQLEPVVLFSNADQIPFNQWQQANNEFTGLIADLPANVHLLTVEPWKDDTILIRLEHFLQKTDDPSDLSKTATVNLDTIFSAFRVISVRETALAGNLYLEESNRMGWRSEGFENTSKDDLSTEYSRNVKDGFVSSEAESLTNIPYCLNTRRKAMDIPIPNSIPIKAEPETEDEGAKEKSFIEIEVPGFKKEHLEFFQRTAADLVTGLKTHPEENPSLDKTALEEPLLTNIGEKSFWCSYCDYTCSSKGSLTKHMQTHSRGKPFSCSFCSYSCSRNSDLVKHLRTHTGEKPFSCSYCDCSFSRKESLKNHIQTHSGVKPFPCSVCQFTCSQIRYLKIHMLSHSEVKPFPCSFCSFTSATKAGMIKHSRTHSGNKPFSCTECNYTCLLKGNLKRHMFTHTGEKPYSCADCKFSCSLKENLKTHVLNHTGEKPFSCPDCNYTCSRKGSLKIHSLTHSGERAFSCSECKFSCSLKGNLRRHMLSHTENKPFPCSECNSSFSQKRQLSNHILTHSEVITFPCID